MELSKRQLGTRVGVRLPTTLAFDHPTLRRSRAISSTRSVRPHRWPRPSVVHATAPVDRPTMRSTNRSRSSGLAAGTRGRDRTRSRSGASSSGGGRRDPRGPEARGGTSTPTGTRTWGSPARLHAGGWVPRRIDSSTPTSSRSAPARREYGSAAAAAAGDPAGRRWSAPGSTTDIGDGAQGGVFVGVMSHEYLALQATTSIGATATDDRDHGSVASAGSRTRSGPRGPSIDDRHGVFVVAGRYAPGLSVLACRRRCELALTGGVTVAAHAAPCTLGSAALRGLVARRSVQELRRELRTA